MDFSIQVLSANYGTQRVLKALKTIRNFLQINLLLIYSDKKHTSIIPLPYCTCSPSFNWGHFVISEQLPGAK